MRDRFIAHTIVNLKFLARNRVLLGFALLLLLACAVLLLPAMFLDTTSNRFEVIKFVADRLHLAAAAITSALGLLVLWSHRRARTIKLIATKPGAFDVWVASVFASAALFGVAAHTVVALLVFALSVAWGVPYQIGFVFLSATWLAQSAIALACLTALGTMCHPIVAILTLAFANDWTLHSVGVTLGAAVEAGHDALPLRAARLAVSALYYAAPSFAPFEDQMRVANDTLRVAAIDWRYLWATFAYALLTGAFGYIATVVMLRRRQLT
jgi:hypothetical protein